MRCIVFAGLFLVAATATAGAHAFLEQATPGAGASVKPAPKAVVLQYSESLEPDFSGVSVEDSQGRDVTAGVASVAGNTMNVPLKPLPPGSYRVQWHALSVDTHRTDGSFTFSVSP